MPAIIEHLKLSLIWMETYFNVISSTNPQVFPYGFFGRMPPYREYFDKIKASDATRPGLLDFPWPPSTRRHFWTYYLDRSRPGQLSSNQAWKALIPFRGKVPCQASASWLGTNNKLLLEAYYYPFGVTLAITADMRDPRSIKKTVEWAHQVRHSGIFAYRCYGEAKIDRLGDVADETINVLRSNAIGNVASLGGHRMIVPFTLATVVQGKGIISTNKIPNQSSTHRALDALSTWSTTWSKDPLPDFNTRELDIKTSPAGHTVYGSAEGQVVWLPELFKRPDGKIIVSSYHRNLLLASVHTRSLLEFLQQTAQWIQNKQNLTALHRWYAKTAIEILAKLYVGEETTYKTWSTRVQIAAYLPGILQVGQTIFADTSKFTQQPVKNP